MDKNNGRDQTAERLKKIRHIVLDLDGTIYNGRTLFPFIKDFLGSLEKLRIDFTFITNNSSRSVTAYIRKLREMGLPANRSRIYTSSQATIDFMHAKFPELTRIYVLGTNSLRREFSANGFVVIDDHQDVEPQAVVVGFDTTLNFRKLCRAAYWIKAGKTFIATHPDLVCPTDQPTLLVDCGAICAALQAATGEPPVAILGKPDPAMIRGILQRHDLRNDEVAIVGDRLYTDIELARRANVISVLVLSGETTRADLQNCTQLPDLILENVSELAALLGQSR
ncbi:MAG: HAD-IIA family hydrolase [Candidatus Neomarinimicrobiota bacterium]